MQVNAKKISIVFSTQRTGSSWLFLHFHNDIHHVCYEPYNSDTVREEYRAIASEPAFKNRNTNVVEYLELLSRYGVIDIKLEIAPQFVLDAIFRNIHRFNPIVLLRDNMLKQYISFLTANRSMVFHGSKRQEEAPLVVDINSFERYIEKIRHAYRRAIDIVDYFRLISYENMDMDRISRYLGVDISNTPKTVRLHRDYSFVENWKELKNKYPQWTI